MIKTREWLVLMLFPVYWIWKNDLLTVLLNGHFLSFFLQMILPIIFVLMSIGFMIADKKLNYDDYSLNYDKYSNKNNKIDKSDKKENEEN